MPHILVVEDSLTQAMELEFLLEEAHFSVQRAANAQQALDLLENPQADLIISDITMPGMDGFSLCRQVKETPETAHIPILLLTNLSEPSHLIQGLEAHADGYVTKPFDAELLVKQINALIRRTKAPVMQFKPQTPIDIQFSGARHQVTADRRQILDLLLCTYENTLAQNAQLQKKELELKRLNENLSNHIEQLAASEERFRGLVQTIPDIVYRIDAEGRFIFLNDAIRHLGYDPDELVGQHFGEIIDSAQVAEVSHEALGDGETPAGPEEGAPKLFDEHRTGERMTRGLEVRLKCKTCQSLWRGELNALGEEQVVVEVNSSGLFGGSEKVREYIGTVGVVRDISERKRDQQRIQEAKDQAEEMARRAELANKAKSAFLATMSHEIRTPMNAIIGMADIVDETASESERREAMKVIRKSGQSLLTLINDILDLAKIESGRFELAEEVFQPREVLENVFGMMRHHVEKQRCLTLKRDVADGVPLWVKGDFRRIRQVLTNLVGNAAKFTETGHIDMRLQAPTGPDGKQRLLFSVADTGVGIPEAEQTAIFESFVQVDDGSGRRHGGTGLGLAISQRLIGAMGGEIQVESVEGQGSVFSFAVPVSEVAAAPIPVEAPEAADPAIETEVGERPAMATEIAEGPRIFKPAASLDAQERPPAETRILLAEDDPVNQLVLMKMFKQFGVKPALAVNGREAVERTERETFDLVFMDGNMPEMDGFDACRAIRAREAEGGGGAHVTIVALTAFAMAEDRRRCLDVGMDDYLSKPVRARDLQGMIQRWVGRGAGARATKAASPSQSRNDGVVDLMVLQELKNDIGTEFDAIVGLSLMAIPELAESIRRAVERNCPEDIRRFSHRLKSAGSQIGAHQVSILAEKLEQQSGQASTEVFSKLLSQLNDEAVKIHQVIQDFLEKEAATSQRG